MRNVAWAGPAGCNVALGEAGGKRGGDAASRLVGSGAGGLVLPEGRWPAAHAAWGSRVPVGEGRGGSGTGIVVKRAKGTRKA